MTDDQPAALMVVSAVIALLILGAVCAVLMWIARRLR